MAKLIEVWECEVCGERYDTGTEAAKCEQKHNWPYKIGDVVKVRLAGGAIKTGKVVASHTEARRALIEYYDGSHGWYSFERMELIR